MKKIVVCKKCGGTVTRRVRVLSQAWRTLEEYRKRRV